MTSTTVIPRFNLSQIAGPHKCAGSCVTSCVVTRTGNVRRVRLMSYSTGSLRARSKKDKEVDKEEEVEKSNRSCSKEEKCHCRRR